MIRYLGTTLCLHALAYPRLLVQARSVPARVLIRHKSDSDQPKSYNSGPASGVIVRRPGLYGTRSQALPSGMVESHVGRICEILQCIGSSNDLLEKADYVLVQVATLSGRHAHYDMPHVALTPQYSLVPLAVSLNMCLITSSALTVELILSVRRM